jgi:hypothetical protein
VIFGLNQLREEGNAYFSAMKVTVESTMVDPVERKSVIHCFSAANSPVGPYGPIEILLMMTFDETVSVVKRIC